MNESGGDTRNYCASDTIDNTLTHTGKQRAMHYCLTWRASKLATSTFSELVCTFTSAPLRPRRKCGVQGESKHTLMMLMRTKRYGGGGGGGLCAPKLNFSLTMHTHTQTRCTL